MFIDLARVIAKQRCLNPQIKHIDRDLKIYHFGQILRFYDRYNIRCCIGYLKHVKKKNPPITQINQYITWK